MTYGMRVGGVYNQILIDENYSNKYPISDTPLSRNYADGYPPGTQPLDIVIGRLPVGVNDDLCGGGLNRPDQIYILRDFAGNFPEPTSGYGMKVKDPNTGQMKYAAGQGAPQKAFSIIASGAVDSGEIVAWPFGTVPDLDTYWFVLNGTALYGTPIPGGSATYGYAYRYHWTGGTSGYIEFARLMGVGRMAWMIMKEITA